MVPYDLFTEAFLDKVTEYNFPIDPCESTKMVDRYMKRAIARFKYICLYDLTTTQDDKVREFDVEIEPEDVEEIVEIVSEGMIVQWLKPYANSKENLENALNTRDFTGYSPANLLTSITDAYYKSRQQYEWEMRAYSYKHGDLTNLHL